MALKIDSEFKEALLNLPQKEKDKYFLRLLKKDDILFHRLKFELISNDSQDSRRNDLEQKIADTIAKNNSHSPKIINSLIRCLSGDITYHTRTTNDKFGEPYLNTFMLVEVLKKHNAHISTHNNFPIEKLNKYIVARVFKVLSQVYKLHEDNQFEFNDLFTELAELIQQNPILTDKCNHANLSLDWLLDNEIPENLPEISKQARALGVI